MAKFIELEDGRWLNADKIELMFTGVSTWRKENKSYIDCSIQAKTSRGTRYTLIGITRSGVIPEGKKRKFDEDLEESVNLIHTMDAVINNIQAEEAEECE